MRDFFILLPLATLMFLSSGCGLVEDESESNVTLSVRVSTMVYMGDDNETNTTRFGIGEALGYSYQDRESVERYPYGRWDFYENNLTQARVIENAIYLNDVNCSDFNIPAYSSAPTLKAPANGSSQFPYINVNPFTTLLVDLNLSADELNAQFDFPAAYDVDPDFNFDTFSARNDRKLPDEMPDYNLSNDICRALGEVIARQEP
jgi:hypothetical protein